MANVYSISIQNLVQFDADYTLDVHSAHLYPFDHYFLTGTLRAVDRVNRTIHIAKLATIGIVSSWDISTADVETLQTVNSTYPTEQARDFDMHVSRPNGHRAFTMFVSHPGLRFALNLIPGLCSQRVGF